MVFIYVIVQYNLLQFQLVMGEVCGLQGTIVVFVLLPMWTSVMAQVCKKKMQSVFFCCETVFQSRVLFLCCGPLVLRVKRDVGGGAVERINLHFQGLDLTRDRKV